MNAEKYILELTEGLKARFGQRLTYVGLQGSYLRGEAHDQSDIDIMVIIDGLSVSDLESYRDLIRSMEYYEKSCGFICSRGDIQAWNPLEICGLLHGTKDYYGTLSTLVPSFTQEDVRNFAKLSLNNLYHEICHRFIHASRERNTAALSGSYKSTFFILQTLVYLRSGVYVPTKRELLDWLSGTDRIILETAMAGESLLSFDEAFACLFHWCQKTLASI